MFSLWLHISEPAGVNKTKLVNLPVSPRPHNALAWFEGSKGNSFTGLLSLSQRPDGYSSPLGYLPTENTTCKGQVCEPAYLNTATHPCQVFWLVLYFKNKPICSEPFAEQHWTRVSDQVFSISPTCRAPSQRNKPSVVLLSVYLHKDPSLPYFAEKYFLCKHMFCNSSCLCCQTLILLLSALMINN